MVKEEEKIYKFINTKIIEQLFKKNFIYSIYLTFF